MPRNLGSIDDPKSIITREYADNTYLSKSSIPKLIVGTHVLSEESSTIPIPSTIPTSSFILYQNGVLLSQDLNYTVSGSSVNLVDYVGNYGDIFTFISIG